MLIHAAYDVFLSYKSENANNVRAVAEDLIARSVRVWFNEYCISSQTYNDDLALHDALRIGIERASCHVVFTNRRWATAEWCRAEMRWICQIPEASRRILQVYLPEEEESITEWPILRHVPSIRFAGDVSVVRRTLIQLGWLTVRDNEEPPILVTKKHLQRKFIGYGVSFNPGPLRETDETPWFFQEALRRPGEHYYFRGQVNDRPVHAVLDINPHRTVLADHQVTEAGAVDDREIYRSYLQAAGDWLKGLDREELGFHLVFVQGHSHFALTSVQNGCGEEEATWERHYALVLNGPKGGIAGELDITFGVSLDNHNLIGAAADFSKLAALFDHIINSFETRVDFSAFSREWWAAALVRSVIVFIAWVIADILSTQAQSWIGRGGSALYLGATSVSLFGALFDIRSRWQMSRWGIMLGPKSRLFPTFGSWLDRVWNRAVGALVLDLLRIGLGLLTIGWLLAFGLFFLRQSWLYWAVCGVALCATGTVIESFWAHTRR